MIHNPDKLSKLLSRVFSNLLHTLLSSSGLKGNEFDGSLILHRLKLIGILVSSGAIYMARVVQREQSRTPQLGVNLVISSSRGSITHTESKVSTLSNTNDIQLISRR